MFAAPIQPVKMKLILAVLVLSAAFILPACKKEVGDQPKDGQSKEENEVTSMHVRLLQIDKNKMLVELMELNPMGLYDISSRQLFILVGNLPSDVVDRDVFQ